MAADPDIAFYRLYDREAPVVLRYLRAALPDLPTAEDLCADAFCRALDGWRRFKGDDELVARAWVMRIARNVLIDHVRRSKRLAFVALDHRQGTGGESDAAVDRLMLNQAMLMLGADDRDLLGMRMAGLSHAEIATIRGNSEEAVKKAWQRALDRVRKHLEGA